MRVFAYESPDDMVDPTSTSKYTMQEIEDMAKAEEEREGVSSLEALWQYYTGAHEEYDTKDPRPTAEKEPKRVQYNKSVEFPVVDRKSGQVFNITLSPDGKSVVVAPVLTIYRPEYNKGVTYGPKSDGTPNWMEAERDSFPEGLVEFDPAYLQRMNPTTVDLSQAASSHKSDLDILRRLVARMLKGYVRNRVQNPYAK